MTRATGLATAVVALVVACAICGDARANRHTVRVTVVSDPQIRVAMHEALEATPGLDVVPRGSAELELRGTVAELQRRQLDGALEVRARVTIVVADARGGAVRAMLTGRAGARGGSDVERLSRNALNAAVRSALRSLPRHGRRLARR